MNAVTKVSRRSFVRTTGLAGSALILGVRAGVAKRPGIPGSAIDALTFEPNVFVAIGEDGVVQLTVHRTEMGQGGRTACCMLLAEELDVDIADVSVVQALADPKYGRQATSGSTTVRLNWLPLRRAGAAAREMLVEAAARRWGVPAADCRTESGTVIHGTDRLSYGDVAADAAELPVPRQPALKEIEDFKIVGTPQTLIDTEDMVRGEAVYGYDIELPDLLIASIERSPVPKGSIRSFDAAAARAVRDVVDVIELEANSTGLTNAGVAVLATNTWAAMQGRAALDIEWEPGPLATETSDARRVELERIAAEPGRVAREEGDFEAAAESADRLIEATYHAPYAVHAMMEPPACTARVEGDRCEVWSATQGPQWTAREVAGALGIPAENVAVHVTLLGGGFGRKSKPDYAVEAAVLARETGRPVKVLWTREDEVRHGFYRAESYQVLRAALGADGAPTGWFHRTVFPGIGWGFPAGGMPPSAGELDQGLTTMPYRFPSIRLESAGAPSSVRIGWLRSVCNTFHAHAVQSFMDELAHELGRDPFEFQMEMLGAPRVLVDENDRNSPYPYDTGRLRAVAEAAADMAGWGRGMPDRRGLGFAMHFSFNSYAAMVADVSVSRSGELTVHQVDVAIDCGPVVNPSAVEAQMQGAVAMGLSLAKYGKITLLEGAVVQGNFDDYPVVRMSEMPKVNLRVIETGTVPTGIGEPGVPPTMPAVTNAIFAATGMRIRDLPLAGQELG
ncbi:MAG: xanthine dehydrogenase family protein molybdopterin-binding subunit [Gemmatimonadetes bacterium]|nr:xanthine dehydrogenase family protein molybdopterin-binding subunit [Gemmatimonadota bacterium]